MAGTVEEEAVVLPSGRIGWSTAVVAAATVGSLIAIAIGTGLALSLNTFTALWDVQVPVRETPAFMSAGYYGWQPLAIDGFGREWLMLTGVDRWTTAMATAPHWVGIVVGGLVGLALVPVLRSLALRDGLTTRHAGHLMAVAGLVVMGWVASVALPYAAARSAIAGEVTGLPADYLAPVVRWTWWPLAVVVLLVLLALAVRHGARAASDTEGLV